MMILTNKQNVIERDCRYKFFKTTRKRPKFQLCGNSPAVTTRIALRSRMRIFVSMAGASDFGDYHLLFACRRSLSHLEQRRYTVPLVYLSLQHKSVATIIQI